jgi:hypothetical protein
MNKYTKTIVTSLLNNLINHIEQNANINEEQCIHDWIYDLIDINPDKSITVCYCCKCELTKS